MSVSIVEASKSQSDSVVRLILALLSELDPGGETDENTLSNTAEKLIGNSRSKVIALLAMDGEEPVGVLLLNECAAIYAGGFFGEISELYVLPSYRSQGIAAQLMDQAKTVAASQQWTRLEVGAPPLPEWSRTESFYLRNGFQSIGPRLKIEL